MFSLPSRAHFRLSKIGLQFLHLGACRYFRENTLHCAYLSVGTKLTSHLFSLPSSLYIKLKPREVAKEAGLVTQWQV